MRTVCGGSRGRRRRRLWRRNEEFEDGFFFCNIVQRAGALLFFKKEFVGSLVDLFWSGWFEWDCTQHNSCGGSRVIRRSMWSGSGLQHRMFGSTPARGTKCGVYKV
jgi:hypothetical protein